MVMLPQGYCIDSTEVTRAQYQAWLDTNPSTAGQITDCSWNTSFGFVASCMGQVSVCQGSGCGDHPQVCVNWCDAYAYCQAVGKRLCGKIGGGSNAFGDYANASVSQWYNACVSDGTNDTYPYGTSYSRNACNGSDHGVGTTVPVGSMTSCQSSVSGHQGVYDLAGNVWEWEDSCDGTAQSAGCWTRGGSFSDDESGLRCDLNDRWYECRGCWDEYTGFRCCS